MFCRVGDKIKVPGRSGGFGPQERTVVVAVDVDARQQRMEL